MTWKRFALAALLASATLPLGFFLSKAALAEWYMHLDERGDGQVGMSVLFGSLFNALICGAVMFCAVMFYGRRSR